MLPSSILAVDIKFEKNQGLEQLPKQTVWSIAKDSQGFIWFGNNAGLFRYDGYQTKPIDSIIPTAEIGAVRAITADNNGQLWVGTKGNGLFQIKGAKLVKFNPASSTKNQDANFITAILPVEDGLWFASYNSLNRIDLNNKTTYYELPGSTHSKVFVTSLVEVSDQHIMLTTFDSIYLFDKFSGHFVQQKLAGISEVTINLAYQDSSHNIWLATNLGVFKKPHNGSEFEPYRADQINFQVNSIVADKKNIWLGTIMKGLVRISKDTGFVTHYKHDINNQHSIPGDSIMAMQLDESSGVLFTSSFHGGVSYFDSSTLNFGRQSNHSSHFNCAESSVFYGIDLAEKEVIWIATPSGLIEYSATDNQCTNHSLDNNNKPIYIEHSPKYSFKDSSNVRWIITTNGLHKINSDTGLINVLAKENLHKNINFMTELRPQQFLIGTNSGLYIYRNDLFEIIELPNGGSESIEVHGISELIGDKYYLATSEGLAVFDSFQKFKIASKIQSQLPTENIDALLISEQHDFWLALHGYGLYRFDSNNNLISTYTEQQGFATKLKPKSMIQDRQYIWISTDNGLLQLNTLTDVVHHFHTNDGLQGEFFFPNSVAKSSENKLYFGGRNGLNAFFSDDIKIKTNHAQMALTQFTRFGKTVKPQHNGQDFHLQKPINELSALNLTHRDYVIGFEFSALDYADPSNYQYAYKMVGLDPDWNYVSADNRTASYTNLKAGNYILKVKGSNKNGLWSRKEKQLSIMVYPAPWFSWWAYTLYAVTFMLLLFGYLHRKNQANQKITMMLRAEVEKQTQELQQQKQTVETLLDKKNELFANVSHEFRTPLTLILGPINKLLNSQPSNQKISSLQMINRNANRLLTMVEQILQLAKLTDLDRITFIPQQVHNQVELIVESFQILAETKTITLNLQQNHEAAINATQDSIELILGNLLSNAIKYTPNGGTVTVNSKVSNNQLELSVTDTGCGLDQQQQVDIFNRFVRLENHHGIPGVGIGLSLVAEIVKVNNGLIDVFSQPGAGSTFSVTFECIELHNALVPNNEKLLIEQLIKESVLDEEHHVNSQQFIGHKNNPNLLIIDDNKDMREHIADCLKDQYYCMLASRGKTGIALAIKHIPEIIICDVMMPEMDGYQVSRILRADSRTSHVPLILLTALNDKQSRIKGWRENIDVYLTKPFDAQELLLQLENILIIRNILKKQANAAIQTGKISTNSGLAKLDQEFLDKFIGIIEEMYTSPGFQRPQMASLMAVSERQLQRKIKALIDRNPLDLLREYRLKKAAEILKEGHQVSITADRCGFNSVTYFSKCFKQQYGTTPRAYQSACQIEKK